MRFRARVHKGDTTKLHLAVMKPFGGDFDGDEITLHVLHDIKSQAESELMDVEENLTKGGNLIVGFVQHAAIGVYKLTSVDECKFTYQDVYDLVIKGNNIHYSVEAMKRWPCSNTEKINGKQLFQMLLPTYPCKSPLTASELNRCMFLYMQQTSKKDTTYISYISFLTRILELYCFLQGITLTLHDYDVTLSPDAIEKSKQLCQYANQLCEEEKDAEQQIIQCLSRARDVLASSALDQLKNRKYGCGLLDIVNSGGKGTTTNIAQSIVMVGLQVNGTTNERNKLAINQAFPSTIQKYALIVRPFREGLRTPEFFYHIHSTRFGLIAQSLDTSESGYLYRKLWKFLEDLRISFDGSVRNANNHLIMAQYGFETTMIVSQPLILLHMTSEQILDFYLMTGSNGQESSDSSCVLEVYKLLVLRNQILAKKQLQEDIDVPISAQVLKNIIQEAKKKRGKIPKIGGVPQSKIVSQQTAHTRVLSLWIKLVTHYHVPNNIEQECYFFELLATRHLFDWNILNDITLLEHVLDFVEEKYKKSVCQDGTPVGFSAAQHIAEPLSQAQLKRMAISGESTPLMTGLARLKEIFNLSLKLQTPYMAICIRKEYEDSFDPFKQLVELYLQTIITNGSDLLPVSSNQSPCLTCKVLANNYPTGDDNSTGNNFCQANVLEDMCHVTLYLDTKKMIAHKVRPRFIAESLLSMSVILGKDRESVHIRYNTNLEEEIWFITLAIPRTSPIFNFITKGNADSFSLPVLSLRLYHALKYESTIFSGIPGITSLFQPLRKDVKFVNEDGNYVTEKRLFYETSGSNLLAVCLLREVDIEFTTTNNIHQIYQVFGIDAAMCALEQNIYETMVSSKAAIASKHVSLIAHTMCHSGKPIAMTFAGMQSKLGKHVSSDASYIKLASFERCMDSFIGAGISGAGKQNTPTGKRGPTHKCKGHLRGVSESIFAGTQMSLGTGGDFTLLSEPSDIREESSQNNIRQESSQKIEIHTQKKINQIQLTNWNTIKKNLKAYVFELPDMNRIVTDLQSQPTIPFELQMVQVNNLTKIKKCSKSAKRKEMEEAARWGALPDDIIPPSPKRSHRTTCVKEEADVFTWELNDAFLDSP
jgi:DNA-directed RNA polymerase II subunit RPB1